MAQATAKTTKTTVARSDGIMDLASDLKLLKLATDYPTVLSMKKARTQRIEELRQTNGSLEERHDRIVNDVLKTRDRRHILKAPYEKLKEVLRETQAVRPKERDQFLSLAEDCIQDLRNKKFTVLIAGETSSGKSSLINLLLGETVLPTAILANTFTICEISYGTENMAVIRFANPGREPKTLKGKTFGQLTDFINKRKDDEDHCERIEIKLPHPLLKGGVVIVDSPGIGDSQHDGKKTMNYMRQAFAFVYVINSSNAGGTHDDRLEHLLREWKGLYESRHRGISSKSCLFVCNKWDQVQEKEKEKVKKDTIKKLKRMIPDLDHKSQVMEISVEEASKVQQKFDVLLEDFSNFMSGLQGLILLCFKEKIDYFYRLIGGQLRNLSDQVKGDIRNAKSSQEERIKTREEVQTKLEKLKQGTHIQEIEDTITYYIGDICDRLVSYLVLSNVKRAFSSWKEQDVPLKDLQKASATRVKEAFDRCVAERFQSIIDTWERKEKLLSQAHDDLAKRFDRGFYDLEKDIHDIDRTLAGQPNDEFQVFNPETFRTPNNPRMKKFLVVTLGIFMPVLFPVGLAAGVLSAPIFGYLVIAKHFEEKQLKNHPCESLAEISIEFLESFIKHEGRNRIQEEFSEEIKRVAGIKECSQELITKYQQKCNDLLARRESESTERETLQRYSALDAKLREMNEKLTFDAIEHGVHPMNRALCQIDNRNLLYDERDVLGSGAYGKVFKGKLSLPGRHGNRDVAVKKLKEPPQPANVDCFLHEAANLMQLKHKNIVTFHGVVMDIHQHKFRSLVLVFDMCRGTLKDHIFKNKEHIPWKTPSAVQQTLHWAEDILDALMFIHAKHIVHRDLKLDNVLISQHRHIKVADLGIASVEDRITGTICGTPLYVAPEVLDRKAYGTKADMYSFGLIMWEMWYGKRVFSEKHYLRREEFLRQIKDENYRPQFPTSDGGPNPTLSRWIEVMKRCWDGEPSRRPTATECKDFVTKLWKRYSAR